MAGIRGYVSSGAVTATAADAKTMLQITAAANHRVKVTGVAVTFTGVSATDAPALVDVLRQTTAGTGTTVTPVLADNTVDETIQTTAKKNCSAEPAAGDVLYSMKVHPQSGWQMFMPYGQEIIVPGGGRLGARITLGATPATCETISQFDFEE